MTRLTAFTRQLAFTFEKVYSATEVDLEVSNKSGLVFENCPIFGLENGKNRLVISTNVSGQIVSLNLSEGCNQRPTRHLVVTYF